MFNNGLSPLTKAPFSTIVTPFVCRKLRQYLNLSVRWMFLLLFRSMNKQENRGVLYQQDLCERYSGRVTRAKKSQPVSRLAFVLFKPVLHRFFGQLDNAQLRDRFGQFRRRLSVIYVAVRAANVLFSLTFRFHGSRFVEILAANCGVGQKRSRCQAALQECRQTDR